MKTIDRRLSIVLFAWLLFYSPCQATEVIKVGFVGGLTGRTSDLGTAGRNGVIYAVEEKNASGGLLGRPVELIVKDDRQDPEAAVQADRQLIDEGVIAIIGHMTSAMSLAAKPLIDEKKMFMISPTSSTTALSGQKDFFFRVVESVADEARTLAEFAHQKQAVKSLAVIYDLANAVYTEDYYASFKKRFEQLGGRISITQTFTSGKSPPFSEIIKKSRDSQPGGLFILANASDTAMFCQQAAKIGWKIPRIVAGWAMTEDLPALGGKSVEGVRALVTYDAESQEPKSREFVRLFRERFGKKPGFPAVCSYSAARVLFDAYERAGGEKAKLRETIVNQRTFMGLQGEIVFDEYGDAHNQKYLTTILNGQFKQIVR
jgi:branched-chain amino acid transport system substrate-binding protein